MFLITYLDYHLTYRVLQIKESLQTVPKESDSIFDLATTIVANSQSSVTVPLCARLALLASQQSLTVDDVYIHTAPLSSGRFMLNPPTRDTGIRLTKGFYSSGPQRLAMPIE